MLGSNTFEELEGLATDVGSPDTTRPGEHRGANLRPSGRVLHVEREGKTHRVGQFEKFVEGRDVVGEIGLVDLGQHPAPES